MCVCDSDSAVSSVSVCFEFLPVSSPSVKLILTLLCVQRLAKATCTSCSGWWRWGQMWRSATQQGRRPGISHVASLTWPVSNCWEETLVSVCMQPFVTKLGTVVHHHKLECHAKKNGLYLQGQGHSVGLYHQNMMVSTILSLLVLNQ